MLGFRHAAMRRGLQGGAREERKGGRSSRENVRAALQQKKQEPQKLEQKYR